MRLFPLRALVPLLLLLAPLTAGAQFDDEEVYSDETAEAGDAEAVEETPAAKAPAPEPAQRAEAQPAPAPAPQAGETPSAIALFVHKDNLSHPLAVEAEHLFTERLQRSDRLRPFDPQPILLAAAEPPGRSSRRAAKLAFEQGKGSYEMLDLEPAVTYFQESIRHYVDGLVALEDLEPLVRSLSYLGATHFLAGNRERAHQAFKHVLVLRPDHQPDPAIFSPPLLEAFDGARWEVSTEGKGQVTISSTPPYAEVWVDDVYRGLTPLTIEDLPVGNHYAVVRKRAFAPAAERVKVTTDPQTVELRLEPGSGSTLYGSYAERAVEDAGPHAMPESIGRLATMLAADRLLLGRVSTNLGVSTLEVIGYDVRASSRNVRERIEFEASSSDWRELLTAFADRTLAAAAVPAALVVAEREAGDPGSVGGRWWMWTAGGVGAALIAGAAYALMAGATPPEAPRRPDDGLIILGIP